MLVTAFQETFEVQALGSAPLTVQNVLCELTRWLHTGLDPVAAERVVALRELVLEARRDTEQDLAVHQPCAELAALMGAMIEDYQLLTALLRLVANRIEAGDLEQLQVLTEELVAADAQLADSEAALSEWEGRSELRCPGCGQAASSSDWSCPRHGVGPLYPDPDPQTVSGQAELGDHYLAVFAVYQGVLDGSCHLDELEAALNPLETMLRRFVNLARGEDAHGETTTRALERIVRASTRSLQGTQRMRASAISRQTRDLNAGWNEVFVQAAEIQQCVPLIARAFGGAAAAAQRELAAVTRPQDNLDIDFD